MPTTRLVAVDLDGTLLTSQSILAPRGANLLRRISKAGIHVVLTTARKLDATRRFCQQMGLSDPMICTNGAQIWATPEGPVWAEYAIPRAVALAIAHLADERGWEITTAIGEITYCLQRFGQSPGSIASNRRIVKSNSEGIAGDPVRILAFEATAIEGLNALCLAHFGQQCNTEIFYNQDGSLHSLGIFPKNADKGTALRMVMEKLEISLDEVIAVGDNISDLAMFKVARISVAMGNAPAVVKQSATAVAPTNDEEGVAWAIETYLK